MTFSVMVIVNFIGNSLVISVVLLNKSMKTPINYLLMNLAVADMIVALFSSVQFIISPAISHPTGAKGTLLCKFLTGGNPAWIGAIASIFSLIALAFERYCAVLHPHSIRLKLTKRKILLLIILCWFFSVVFTIPGFWWMVFFPGTNTCGHKWTKQVYAEVYTIEASQRAILRCRKRATKMVIAVTFIYVLCWVPELSIYFLGFTGLMKLTYLHRGIALSLIVFNSSINPVIYSLQSSTFRRHVSDLIRCKQTKNRIFPGGNSTSQTR
ncbi:unnamed protein product [Pocillopora meandrina]|uniref:G-protein coupled receptors family 1 profile domain-containing protein n=1 Tax=Pocillopora meandrina TaxID=46732 RepID=A0AAU9VXN6_9CNID|nr:unnamed protein product [Pocillopora meandrina]